MTLNTTIPLSVATQDNRQLLIIEKLKSLGFCASPLRSQFEPLGENHGIILPVPVSRDGVYLNGDEKIKLSDILNKLHDKTIVFGGLFPDDFKCKLGERGIKYVDYCEKQTFTVKNAKITAEGAVFYLMREMSKAIDNGRFLVCGYGRIGSMLSYMLKSLGGIVYVAARREESLCMAEVNGFIPVKINSESNKLEFFEKCCFDAIINTVPNRIFDDASADVNIFNNTIYLELASAPYGACPRLVSRLGGKYIDGGGIPGKYAPESAADVILQIITENLSNKEDS